MPLCADSFTVGIVAKNLLLGDLDFLEDLVDFLRNNKDKDVCLFVPYKRRVQNIIRTLGKLMTHEEMCKFTDNCLWLVNGAKLSIFATQVDNLRGFGGDFLIVLDGLHIGKQFLSDILLPVLEFKDPPGLLILCERLKEGQPIYESHAKTVEGIAATLKTLFTIQEI